MAKRRRNDGRRPTFKRVKSKTRFEHAIDLHDAPVEDYYSVNYSIEDVITELRRLDLDVDKDNLSDIKIFSVGRVFETEMVRDLDKVRNMSANMLRGDRFLPIVVSADTRSVIDGHHRLIASIYAGWKYVPVRVLVPVRTMVDWRENG